MIKTYPAITFIAQRGRALAVALSAVSLLATIVAWLLSRSVMGLGVGLVAAAAVWALVRLASEVIEVVAETLLPR